MQSGARYQEGASSFLPYERGQKYMRTLPAMLLAVRMRYARNTAKFRGKKSCSGVGRTQFPLLATGELDWNTE